MPCVVNAMDNRDVETTDTPGTLLQTNMEGTVRVRLDRLLT